MAKTLTKRQAIALFGSQAKLARAVGLSPAAVCQWGSRLTQRNDNAVRGAYAAMIEEQSKLAARILGTE